MNDEKQQGPGNGGGGSPWMKQLLILVGILVALGLFAAMIDGRTAQATGGTIPYSTFLDKVQDGSVKEFNVADEVITGSYTNDAHFRTYAMQDPELTDRLRKAGVTINAQPKEQPSIWMYLLYNSLPFLLFLGIAFFVVRQMQKNSGSGAMGFGK
jgi:cell division protease FtsH